MACPRCGYPIPAGFPRCPTCGRRAGLQEPSAGAILGAVFGLVGIALMGVGFTLPSVEFTPGYPTTASLLDLASGSRGYIWLALVPVLSSGVAAMGLVFLFGHNSFSPTAVRLAVLIPLTLASVTLTLLVVAAFSLGSTSVLEYCTPYGYPGCQTRPYTLREGIPMAAAGAAWSFAGFFIGFIAILRMPSPPEAVPSP